MLDFFIANKKAFIDILSIWILAVMMPGPDMFLVISGSIKEGKPYALACVFGIVVGTLVWLIVGFFLIGILSKTSFFDWVKFVGGSYLIYMTLKMLPSLFAPTPNPQDYQSQGSAKKGFFYGVLTNLSNPKAPIFVSVILSALPPHTPLENNLILFLMMLIIPALWFSFVAQVFSIKRFFNLFLRYSKVIDILAIIIFGAVGIELVIHSIQKLF
ncbi:threonine export protein RhtC [Helicobacter pylori]